MGIQVAVKTPSFARFLYRNYSRLGLRPVGGFSDEMGGYQDLSTEEKIHVETGVDSGKMVNRITIEVPIPPADPWPWLVELVSKYEALISRWRNSVAASLLEGAGEVQIRYAYCGESETDDKTSIEIMDS